MGQSWLVLELTDSSFLVGLVNAMPAMALLVLSPIGGVIADRYDRRLVALYGRLVVAIMSYFVAFLVGSGAIEWWHLMVTGVLIGIAFALSNPATQTIVMDVVGRERMVAAQSLNTTVSNLGNMIGPDVARNEIFLEHQPDPMATDNDYGSYFLGNFTASVANLRS